MAAGETNEMRDCAFQEAKRRLHDVPGADGSFGAVSTSSLSTKPGLLVAEIVSGQTGSQGDLRAESMREVIPCVGHTLNCRTCSASTGPHQRPSTGHLVESSCGRSTTRPSPSSSPGRCLEHAMGHRRAAHGGGVMATIRRHALAGRRHATLAVPPRIALADKA